VCQALHASHVGTVPGQSADESRAAWLRWNHEAAKQGLSASILKMARARLKKIPVPAIPYDAAQAASWFRKGIKLWGEPDCYYGLAQMLLEGLTQPSGASAGLDAVDAAVRTFEKAAMRGHAYAKYNLGYALALGHGAAGRDGALAAEWLEDSGLPEGLHAAAMHYESTGDVERATRLMTQAVALGLGTPWRPAARERTGSGGSAGVSLHSAWPGGIAGSC
jgi:TPR repeat protein